MQTLNEKLSGFFGTEGYHKLTFFGGFLCTDGVYAFAEEGKAYWALDLIASYQSEPKIKAEAFQHWKIASDGKGFEASCDDGNEGILVSQKGTTDLEEGYYHFYLCDSVLMLASEY